MVGTLSSRPTGFFASTDGGAGAECRGEQRNIATRKRRGRLLAGDRLAATLCATILVAIASVAVFVEPGSHSAAPMLSALAATVAGLIWVVQGGIAERPGRACKSADAENETTDIEAIRPSGPPPAPINPSLAAELAQAAALAQLTARISHELRTPLNAVIGFSELMSRETFGPLGSQRYQDYAQYIRECSQSLLKSTEDTLAITSALAHPARDQRAGHRPVALASLLEEASECVALQVAQEGLSLERSVPSTAELFGDHRILRQILLNLLQEAISRARWRARVVVKAEQHGNGIRVDFITQGCREGAPEETLALCVARALLELNGLMLETAGDGIRSWRASVILERALQPDFFLDAGRAAGGCSDRQSAAMECPRRFSPQVR